MSKAVLVTGGRLPGALDLSRALALDGCRVVVTDSFPLYLCQGSRAVARSYVVPPPSQSSGSYQTAILDIISREKIDLVIPTTEEVLYLAAFHDKICCLCDVYFAAFDLLYRCHHKQHFNDLARSIGLPVPQAALLFPGCQTIKRLRTSDFVLKRCLSRSGDGIEFSSAGSPVDKPIDGTWQIQERIPGETLCSFSAAHHGTTLLTIVYSPSVTYRTIGVVFTAIDEPKIVRWVERFVRETGFHGFISFDFIRDPEGNVFAVECNPRLTSGIHLAPLHQIARAILTPGEPQPPSHARKSARITLGVLSALPRLLLMPKSAWKAVRESLRSQDVILQWHDPGPYLYQIPSFAYALCHSYKEKISLSDCAMNGVEWNMKPPGNLRVWRNPEIPIPDAGEDIVRPD